MIPAHIDEDTIVRRIHRDLEIPDGYYRAEVQAEPLEPARREAAIGQMVASGVLKRGSTDDIIAAMCDRIMERTAWDATPAPSALRTRVEEAILRNPEATTKALAEITGVSTSTILVYRNQLRKEGKL